MRSDELLSAWPNGVLNMELKRLEMLLSQQEYLVADRNDILLITNSDGLEAYLAVSGEQILVETILFPASKVRDRHGLNDDILRTHKLVPLSTVAINTYDNEDYYVAFGALSARSSDEDVVLEVSLLFRNVEVFLDAFEEHLNLGEVA